MKSDMLSYKLEKRILSWRTIDSGETIIRNLVTKENYLTNLMGSIVWNAMLHKQDLNEISHLLVQKFDLSFKEISSDIAFFVNKIEYFCSRTSNNLKYPVSVSCVGNHEKSIRKAWKDRPQQVQIDVTTICNFDCIHCYLGDLRKNNISLSLDEVKNIILDLKNLGAFSLIISGGEIFTRGDISEIVKYARINGFEVVLMSNCSLLTGSDIAFLKEIGSITVVATLYGSSKEKYREVTNTDSFHKVVSNLKMLREAGISLVVTIPVYKFVLEHLVDMKRIVDELGAVFQYGFDMIPTMNGDLSPMRYDISDLDSIKEQILQQWHSRKKILDGKFFLCSAGRSSFSISANGDVRPCTIFPKIAGNIYKNALNDIWTKSKLFNEIREIDNNRIKCNSCNMLSYCENSVHCYALGFYSTHSLYEPNTKSCLRAKLIKQIL